MVQRQESRRSQGGFTSVLVVGIGTVLLLFVGISVDWGILLRYRRAMYNACDSGALAGALNLKNSPTTAVAVGERYARNDMTQNNIQWDTRDLNGDGREDGVIATPLDANLQATASPPWKYLRVEIKHDVPLFLLRIIRDYVTVRVRCTAKVANIIPDDLAPIGLDYCQWAPLYRNPSDPYALPARCTQPPYPPVSDPQCYTQTGVLPFSARTPAACQAFEITVDVNASGGFGSGNTGLLSFCPNAFDCPSGGSQWNNYFCNVYCDSPPPPPPQMAPYCFDAGYPPVPPGRPPRSDPVGDYEPCAYVKTKPGVTLGQVRQGVLDRCTTYSNGDEQAQYLKLILLNPAFQDDGSGRYTVEIWGFALFQIDCTQPLADGGKTIRGAFVDVVSGRITGRETDLETGAYTIKLFE